MNKTILEIIKLQEKGLLKEAKESYEKLLNEPLSNEDLYIVYANLGNIYFSFDNYSKAKENYELSLNISQKNEKVFFNLGTVYLKLEDLEKAKCYFTKAISINSNYTNAYINLGIVNKKLELLDESIRCFEKAIDINPNESEIYYNYANTLLKLEQYNLSLSLFQKALALNCKDKYKVFYSIGLVYQYKNQFAKALNAFNKSIELKNDYADAHFAKATILLQKESFEEGWKEYEYRWEANNELKRPEYKINWLNNITNLENKRILVQQEQGYGDNIQFIRYINKLVELKAEVFLAVRNPLNRLFSNIKGITLVKDSDLIEDINYFTSLLDLPRVLYKYQNEFLYKEKYLEFIKENIFEVKNKNKINIGFVWRGNPTHKGDKKRNISLEYFEKLFKLKICDFYSLQYENDKELDKYIKKYKNIYKCKDLIKDFNDTANIVTKLDLVITIDTSMVHLCGALGVKTYLILGLNSEWRWLLNRDDSIWYKSIKIFRQNNILTFDTLFDKIIEKIYKD